MHSGWIRSSYKLAIASLVVTPLIMSVPAVCFAQDSSRGSFRIIVPVTPGVSAADMLPRRMSPILSDALGQPVIVENKPGGGGLVAFEYVAHVASPDGHTIAVGSPTLATAHLFVKDLHFDPLRELTPVTKLVEGVSILTSPISAPWNTLSELVSYAKKNPGKLNWGTFGPQSISTLLMQMVTQHYGVTISNIPYKGATDQRTALIANDIQLALYTEGPALADSSRVKVLAVTGNKRLSSFQNTPAFSEDGGPDLPNFWYSFTVPSKTPKVVINSLFAAAAQALKAPDVKVAISSLGLTALGSSPEDSLASLQREAKLYETVANRLGIRPE